MPRLNNAAVRQLGLGYKAAKAREAEAKAEAAGLRDQLLEQLRIRKVTELTVDNVVIARKSKTTRVFALARLRAILTRQQFVEAVPPTPSAKVLDGFVKTGTITGEQLTSAVVDEVESSPWVDVTIVKEAA